MRSIAFSASPASAFAFWQKLQSLLEYATRNEFGQKLRAARNGSLLSRPLLVRSNLKQSLPSHDFIHQHHARICNQQEKLHISGIALRWTQLTRHIIGQVMFTCIDAFSESLHHILMSRTQCVKYLVHCTKCGEEVMLRVVSYSLCSLRVAIRRTKSRERIF